MSSPWQPSISIFADGADLGSIRELAADPLIGGFTTNPTLMRKAGVENYEAFSRAALELITGRPISLEVFADDAESIRAQALTLASWGDNVFVKVPITTTDGTSMAPVIRELSGEGVQLNVTALMTLGQVETTTEALREGPAAYISVFAGRIADTGVDPVPVMTDALGVMSDAPQLELIWASPREVLNVIQADEIGCHVITVTPDLLAKLPNVGRDLDDFSLATVRMFHDDAAASGFQL